jgi:hypothetical protein
MHVHLYFDSTIDVAGIPTELAENMSATWSTVVQKASEKEQTISIEDQRIILCTLSFIIYDLMTVKVIVILKNYIMIPLMSYVNETKLRLYSKKAQ